MDSQHKQNSQEKEPPLSFSPTGTNLGTSSRSFRASTASSESSWNSHSGLLLNPSAGSMINPRGAKTTRISIAKKLLLAAKCCCGGEKSIHTKTTHIAQSQRTIVEKDEIIGQNQNELATMSEDPFKLSSGSSNRPVGFSFPALKPCNDDQAIIKKSMIISNYPVFNPVRDSFESFNPGSPTTTAREEDMESDASSDLFEIESIKNQTTLYQACRGRTHSLEEDAP